MRISYNKLWKMLIDKNMKKSDLKEKAGISSASLAKLGKGDNITTDVLLRICLCYPLASTICAISSVTGVV